MNINFGIDRASIRKCGAQLGTILVGPDSQSTCTKICRIGALGPIGTIGLRQALGVDGVFF